MLTTKKTVEITGNSMIGGVIAETHSAKINSDKPRKLTLTSTSISEAEDAASLQECRADYAQFIEGVYAVQDSMIAEKAAADTATE